MEPGSKAGAPRLPRSYVGGNHETIGSDILAVLQVVKLPEHVLGKQLAGELAKVKPDGWYPIRMLLEPLEMVDKKFGASSLTNVGWELFKLSHEKAIKQTASSAHDIIYGIDGMYHRANRGTAIGGWKVLSFSPGRAELEKTTPHPCPMEEGILQKALLSVGVAAIVTQTTCFRKGADACHFVVTAPQNDPRWAGKSK